jgi:hypothetical protein
VDSAWNACQIARSGFVRERNFTGTAAILERGQDSGADQA